MTKQSNSKVTVSNEGLPSLYKFLIALVSLMFAPISSVVILAIAFTQWSEKYPKKFKDTIKYAVIVPICLLVGLAIISFIAVFILAAINPAAQIEKARQAQIQKSLPQDIQVPSDTNPN